MAVTIAIRASVRKLFFLMGRRPGAIQSGAKKGIKFFLTLYYPFPSASSWSPLGTLFVSSW
ncbi:MAG: hypothetical protein ACAI35_21910, partial [Candidatus Methylacidiphilales bacterium]